MALFSVLIKVGLERASKANGEGIGVSWAWRGLKNDL